jgi:CHASE2 domain-containing sensor protein
MKLGFFAWIKSIGGVSFAVTLILLVLRQLGGLESWELVTFDQMLRLQVKPNPPLNQRIVVVEIKETDIAKQKKWPLPDAVLAKALQNLAQHQPVAIGLDLFRDLPVDPGHQQFTQQLQRDQMIIPVCKVSNEDNPGVKPPQGLNNERVGFADVTVDPAGIVRRGLIFAEPAPSSECQTPFSLAFQLARRYLATQNIEPELTPQEELKWGKSIFKRLSSNDGGYHEIDSRGYQILLNYELVNQPPRILSLDDVLNQRFEPTWIKDKIVLIGVSASSIDDAFYTPYSVSAQGHQKMPGVMIHAQLANQLISVALGESHLFWFWSQWQEYLWIWFWGVVGVLIVYYLHHPVWLSLGISGAVILLMGSSFVIFVQGGWIPLIPASLNLIGCLMLSLSYRTYYDQREKEAIALKLQQQEQDLLLLQALLKNAQQLTVAPDQSTILTQPVGAKTKPTENEIKTTLIVEAKSHQFNLHKLLVGRYQLLKIIASGGFAYAYLAKDIQRPGSPQCLVKQLQPALKDEEFLKVARRLFRNEASILEKLGHHPQIPQLLANFEEDEQFYLVEEFIAGQTLTQEIQENAPFDEATVIKFLKEILAILSYIHSQGVIHRDLKPGNIIRRASDQRLVLIDFGAVKQIQPNLPLMQDDVTIAIGTKGYTPPEQLTGHPRLSSDLYAVGMIAIQSLTGISPDKLPRDQDNGEIKWHSLRQISPSLMKILDKMTAYHFKDRYDNVNLIMRDLNQL